MSPSNTQEPMIIYVTEKGCDLHAAFPELALIESAMRDGISWYDLEEYKLKYVKPRPFTVVATTEADLAAQRAAKQANDTAEQATDAAETILAEISNLPNESRTMDSLVELAATRCIQLPTHIASTVADRICEECYARNLIYTAPAPASASALPQSRHKKHLQWIMSTLEKKPNIALQKQVQTMAFAMPKYDTMLRVIKSSPQTNCWTDKNRLNMIKTH